MSTQLLDVFLHVCWTSMCGGWHYDRNSQPLVNVIHLYFWLYLFVTPLVLSLYANSSYVWKCYTLLTAIVFSLVKYLLYVLHNLSDTCRSPYERSHHTCDKEQIEMCLIGNSDDCADAGRTISAGVADMCDVTLSPACTSHGTQTQRPSSESQAVSHVAARHILADIVDRVFSAQNQPSKHPRDLLSKSLSTIDYSERQTKSVRRSSCVTRGSAVDGSAANTCTGHDLRSRRLSDSAMLDDEMYLRVPLIDRRHESVPSDNSLYGVSALFLSQSSIPMSARQTKSTSSTAVYCDQNSVSRQGINTHTLHGDVHYFQDEFGNWLSYRFQDAEELRDRPDAVDIVSCQTLDTLDDDIQVATLDEQTRPYAPDPSGSDRHAPTHSAEHERGVRKLCLFGDLNLHVSRLWLLSLADRTTCKRLNLLCVLCATLCTHLAGLAVTTGVLYDCSLVIFIFCLAGSQFCLLKSVQPDAVSPTHGHNTCVVFTRAFYFILVTSALLFVNHLYQSTQPTYFTLYGINISYRLIVVCLRDMLVYAYIVLPVFHSLGIIFPQIDTFLHHCLEQFDMHILGGTSMISLTAAFYAVLRSLCALFFLYLFAFLGLFDTHPSHMSITNSRNTNGVQSHIMFSLFCGLSVAVSYHLSRCCSSPYEIIDILKQKMRSLKSSSLLYQIFSFMGKLLRFCNAKDSECNRFLHQPNYRQPDTVMLRLQCDVVSCLFIGVIYFAIHCSTVLNSISVGICLQYSTFVFGLLIHYILPQLRKTTPWLLWRRPLLHKSVDNCVDNIVIVWYERVVVLVCFVEHQIMYPLVHLFALTHAIMPLVERFGITYTSLVMSVCVLKNLRYTYTRRSTAFIVLGATILAFTWDFLSYSHCFLVDFFLMSIVCEKFAEFLLKMQFAYTYCAPWQITWGSAFHAFAQMFAWPHTSIIFVQTALSSILSCPLNPFLGSAVFILSYMRPVRFWERDYNTRRISNSHTQLCHQLSFQLPTSTDNSLNSLFYEHLALCLQRSLCGDLMLGRWASFSAGDCFVLASDYLNCLLHIVEVGNGLVTFQLRGLEFRGTYCQQREVEAVTEELQSDGACCCCSPGHFPYCLSFNQAFSQRWLAWQVVESGYVLQGYSISDNSATSMLQVYELRRVLVTFYVKSLIFLLINSDQLNTWLSYPQVVEVLNRYSGVFVDLDTVFNSNIDEDFNINQMGVSRQSFGQKYFDWISYCIEQRGKQASKKSVFIVDNFDKDHPIVTFCFALSLLARRSLSCAAYMPSYSSYSHCCSVELFLHGLYSVFKGDFRVVSSRDEWVFCDLEIVRTIICPAVRIALKLHLDHFASAENYSCNAHLYGTLVHTQTHVVIAHETDSVWRRSVLEGREQLVSLRHVSDEMSNEQYRVIMLHKRDLQFRVIRLNRECVRGLWCGQLQELIYLRNRNPERGSIQNARQVLRNIINSSCDQPIGYPIYVSPLITSYQETHPIFDRALGPYITCKYLQHRLGAFWRYFTRKYRVPFSDHSCQLISTVSDHNIARHTNDSTTVHGLAATASDAASVSRTHHTQACSTLPEHQKSLATLASSRANSLPCSKHMV